MSVLFQIGISYPHELSSGIGHMAGTLGGSTMSAAAVAAA
jgi:hypothetical protein